MKGCKCIKINSCSLSWSLSWIEINSITLFASLMATNTWSTSLYWNQLLSLMFGQLSNRESLRDLIIALEAHKSKCYHLGMGKNVSRSSLARANQDRDYHIFEEFAYYLVNMARHKRITDILKLDGNVYAFDSTTNDLCLAVF